MTSSFALADNVVCRNTNSSLRMLFDREKGVMYEMNETASAVIELLAQQPATAEELAAAMDERFDASAGEIQADVERMLADFADAGLVTQKEHA